MPSQNSPEDIIREAQALVEAAQRSLAAGESLYRDHGLDPDKLRSQAQADPGILAQAEAQFRADMEDVERQVSQAAAAAGLVRTPTTAGRRPRQMV